jgi:hypothetical protein
MYICSDIYVNNESYITNKEIQQYLQNNNISDDIPEVRASLYTTKLWPKDTILNVVFLSGEPWQKAWVEKVITEEFQPYCPIKFTFDPSGKKTIRITFKESDGAYSTVGTDALNRNVSQPTMNLGWLDAPGGKTSAGQFTFKGKTYTVPPGQPRNKNEVGATVIHEFGHTAGLIHEHQNPRGSGIEWDVDKVYKQFSGPPNNWDKETINRNILKKYDEDQINGSEFDPESIMLYFFDGKLTKNNKGTEANHRLSDLDKKWLQNAYKDASPTTDNNDEVVETFMRNCENITNPIINTSNMANTQFPFLPPPMLPFQQPFPIQPFPMQPIMQPQPQPQPQPTIITSPNSSSGGGSNQSPIIIPIPIPSNNNNNDCGRKNCQSQQNCCQSQQNCCQSQQNCCIPTTACTLPPPSILPPPILPPPPPPLPPPPPPPPRPPLPPPRPWRPYRPCPNGTKKICRNLYGRRSCGPCLPIYRPPPNKIHIHGPGCGHGRRCARGRGSAGYSKGRGYGSSVGRGSRGRGRVRSEDDNEEEQSYEIVENENAPKIKGLGPGIVENFDSKEEQVGIKAGAKVSSIFNSKFLILVTIVIVIGIILYILREKECI